MIRYRSITVLTLCAAACGREPSARQAVADTAAFRGARQLVGSGRFAPAALEYTRLRDSFAAIGDSVNRWYGQLWWTETMIRAGRLDSAASGLAETWALAGDDPRRIGWTNVSQSKWYERRGLLDSAIAVAGRAAEAYRATGDRELGVFAFDALGTPLSRRGRYRDALAADSTSLGLRQAIPLAPRVIGGGYNEVAIGYRHLGRYDEAEAALRRSYELSRSQNDTLAMALALSNRASVMDDTGDRAAAVAALSEAMIYFEALRHRRFITEGNADLARLFLDGGRRDPARGYATRALVMARETGNRPIELSALTILGKILLGSGAPREAQDSLRKAQRIADSLGFGAERVTIRIESVEVAIALSDRAAANRLADQALVIADSLGDPSIQFAALEARARALEAGKSSGASAAYDAALDLLESLRGRLVLGDLRMGVAAPRLSAYEGAIRTHLAAGRSLEAFRVAERAKARLLLDVMVERGGAPASAAGTLRQRLWETHEARAAARDTSQAAGLDRAIAALADSIARIEAAEPLGSPRPVGVEEVRPALLSTGQALLLYFWGEQQVVGWRITRDSVRAAVLGSTDSLERTVDFLIAALARAAEDTVWRAAARRVYRELVLPLGADPGTELLIVPDGPLHRIPLEVLLADSRVPWGASHRIRYGPSASVLVALTRNRPAGWTRALLAVGNPTLWRSPGAGDSARAPTLGPLPYAEDEARAIQGIFRTEGADLLLGDKATVRRWREKEPGRYRFLHFALHAVANDRLIEGGALVFADERLTLADVRQLRLDAELVTLSACETAVGRWVRGEGVVGMQYAFLSAGARATLVTLWRVPDRAAAEFSQAFYTLVKEGAAPAEALRRVRERWIVEGGERAHPSRWAGFILVGGS